MELADPDPHMKKIIKACEILEIPAQAQPEKSFPRTWSENNGRVLIPIDKKNKIPKEVLIDKIAARSRKFKRKAALLADSEGTVGTETSPTSKFKSKRNVSAKSKTRKNHQNMKAKTKRGIKKNMRKK